MVSLTFYNENHGGRPTGTANKRLAEHGTFTVALTVFASISFMAVVAQLVRAQDCGSWGRGFNSRRPPHFSVNSFKARRSGLYESPHFDP